jgi:hypothetical protein
MSACEHGQGTRRSTVACRAVSRLLLYRAWVPEVNRRNMMLMTGMGLLAAGIPIQEARADNPGLRVPSNVRLHGSNIVCNGDPLGKPWKTYGTTVWASMWTVWNWDDWIKPQIDDAAAIGNTVRLWGSTQSFLAGNITEDTYFAQWQQMLDYCAGKGLYMLPTGSDLQTDVQHVITTAKAASHYSTWANMLAQYPGVVGVDLMNEAWGLPFPDAYPHADYEWLMPVLRACADSVHGQGLPAAVSFPLSDSSQWSWSPTAPTHGGKLFAQYPVDPFFELSDYLDIHVYATSTPADVASTYNHPWAAGKQMIFGEFGMTIDHPAAERTAFYDMARQLVSARTDNAGALAWSCYDLNTTNNRCGLYSAPGVLRADIATPFATFPTTR